MIDYSGEDTHTSLDYGTLPSSEAFCAAFDARCPDGTFAFGNDPYVGTQALDLDDLWAELEAQHATWEQGEHAPGCPGCGSCGGEGCPCEDAGSWCSSVLGILGFEWI